MGTVRSLTGAIFAVALALSSCSSGTAAAPTSAPLTGGGSSPAGPPCATQAGLSGPVSDQGTATATGLSVQLTMGDNFYAPTCVVVARSGTLRVTVTNHGQALHNFSISGLGIDEDVPAGSSVTVRVRFPGTGPLLFFCKYHVAAGMQGAFLPA